MGDISDEVLYTEHTCGHLDLTSRPRRCGARFVAKLQSFDRLLWNHSPVFGFFRSKITDFRRFLPTVAYCEMCMVAYHTFMGLHNDFLTKSNACKSHLAIKIASEPHLYQKSVFWLARCPNHDFLSKQLQN